MLLAIIFGQMRLLIIGLLGIGCSTKYEAEKPTIDGDWIFVDDPNEITVDYYGLKFVDDTLYTIADRGLTQEGKFLIKGDTIIVEEFGNVINKQRRIKTFTSDSLILTSGDKYYSRNLEFTDSLKFNEIDILAGYCFGNCPQFSLRLTDKGLVNFKPIADCKVTIEKEFTLDSKQKTKIDSLFKWTYLQKLDTSKVYGATDDWSIDIEIVYNDGQLIEIKTTRSKIPFRLKAIFGIIFKSLREKELI